MTHRDRSTTSNAELPTPLSVLYSVMEDAQRYNDYLEENTQGIHDQELADFLMEYEMILAGGPSEPRVFLPSGWPTAEFSSVLAGTASPTSSENPLLLASVDKALPLA